jgi:hypothetical protein
MVGGGRLRAPAHPTIFVAGDEARPDAGTGAHPTIFAARDDTGP